MNFDEIVDNRRSARLFTNDEVSEKLEMDISGDTLEEKESAIEKGKTIKAIAYTSENNKKIYEQYQAKIIPFVRKNRYEGDD